MTKLMLVATIAAAIGTGIHAPSIAPVANAAEVKLLSAAVMKPALTELTGEFERTTGHKLTISYDSAGQVTRRIQAGEIADVRSRDDVDGWFDVYSAVFGADPRARDEWQHIHASLGPTGEGSLVLLLARVDGTPAATGALFFHEGVVRLARAHAIGRNRVDEMAT